MEFSPVLAASICSLLLACSPSKKSNSANNGAKSYNHLLIIGNTADISARVQLEKDFAAAAATKGYVVVKSMDIFPPSLNDPKPPTNEQIIDSLKTKGCDVLFVVSLKKKEELKYNPGLKVNGTTPVLGDLLASSLGYVNANSSEIKSVDKPGSYSYGNGFFIACDLVDAQTQTIVYSTTSEMIEYSKLNTLGKTYITSLVEQLEAKKILRK